MASLPGLHVGCTLTVVASDASVPEAASLCALRLSQDRTLPVFSGIFLHSKGFSHYSADVLCLLLRTLCSHSVYTSTVSHFCTSWHRLHLTGPLQLQLAVVSTLVTVSDSPSCAGSEVNNAFFCADTFEGVARDAAPAFAVFAACR